MERGDRYNERRWDDYDRDHGDRRSDHYNLDRYDRDYSQTMTEEGTTDITRNNRRTRTTDATIKGEIFAGKQPESSTGNWIQIRSLHHHSNRRRKTRTGTQPGNREKRELSNNRKVYCYYFRKEGNYCSQCPVKTNEKQSAINMVAVELIDVQQVTTRSKGKVGEWESQETIKKQATEWVQKANEWNMAKIQKHNSCLEEPIGTSDNDPKCQVLQEC